MGLCFSHGNAQFGYSSFNTFRGEIAKTLQITLDDMEGFGGKKKWDLHPLTAFLHHSDCDGHLTPQECSVIAPALKEAVEKAFTPDDFTDYYDRGMKIVKGMQEAFTRNEKFKFL